MWRCSLSSSIPLIPAHAGVIPGYDNLLNAISPYPRACGGDPVMRTGGNALSYLSPRMRG